MFALFILFAHEISKLKQSALQLRYTEHGLEVSIKDIKKLGKTVIGIQLQAVRCSAHTISKAPCQVR
jgi:hypothetical protein